MIVDFTHRVLRILLHRLCCIEDTATGSTCYPTVALLMKSWFFQHLHRYQIRALDPCTVHARIQCPPTSSTCTAFDGDRLLSNAGRHRFPRGGQMRNRNIVRHRSFVGGTIWKCTWSTIFIRTGIGLDAQIAVRPQADLCRRTYRLGVSL